nr:MAG TPA: hypothetical protein [Caudoviricetes sp.]
MSSQILGLISRILKIKSYEPLKQISQKIFAAYGAERGNAPALVNF